MKKILILVDCQYDFIDEGKLPVSGSKVQMDELSTYIAACPQGTYSHIVFTADFHPYGHCSFSQWPVHCLQYTHGAAIYEAVYQAALAHDSSALILTKGNQMNQEEYSILQNAENGPKLLALLEEWNPDAIEICGICGDICVKNTILDILKTPYGKKLKVLPQFSPSLDGGIALAKLIKENHL